VFAKNGINFFLSISFHREMIMKIITLPYVGENPILLPPRMFPEIQNTLPVVAIIANDTHLIIILIIPPSRSWRFLLFVPQGAIFHFIYPLAVPFTRIIKIIIIISHLGNIAIITIFTVHCSSFSM
jgi:hypothetical protein